jgi:hypothetical protein
MGQGWTPIRVIFQRRSTMAKTRSRIDRYFDAFETGSMKPELCTEKIQDLKSRIVELEIEKHHLEERRKKLELPAIDREMLSSLLDNFEEVIAAGTNPQKKHLLRLLVKKVLIYDRRTIEIWYGLPNQASVRTPAHLAPRMCQYAIPPRGGRTGGTLPDRPCHPSWPERHSWYHLPRTDR